MQQQLMVSSQEALIMDFFSFLATFLVSKYVIPPGRVNAGKHFDKKSAVAVWGGLIFQTQRRFSKSKREETTVSFPMALTLHAHA